MKRADLFIILGLLIAPLLYFFPVTVGGKTLIPADNLYQFEPWASYRADVGVPETPQNPLLSDLILQNYQWKTFIRQNIEGGEIPLWQPNQFSGTPFWANGQHSVLYPFSVLYYILPLPDAYGWFTVSQLWLAGVLMALFIRGIGLGRGAALVAGLTYQLSSFFIVATVHPMIQAAAAWLPLLLLMLEFIIQRRGNVLLPWVVMGGLALGMNFLAGHIEITYYTLLIMAMYAALRLGSIRPWRQMLTPAGMMLLLVGLGFGIGAVQFIPFLEVADNSFRTERTSLDEVLEFALPTRHVPLWVMPNFYGNPAEGNAFGIKNYVEGGAYVGVLTLVLAGIGVVTARRWLLMILGAVALLFAFGTPAYAVLYYLLPGIDQLHTPFRWIWLITFVLCVFAAYGVEYLLHHERGIRRLTWGLLLAGGIVLAGVVGSLLVDASMVEPLFTGLNAEGAFSDVEAFLVYQRQNALILAFLLLACALILWLSQREIKLCGIPLWLALIPVVIFVDSYVATGHFNPRAEKEWLEFEPPSIAWLQEQSDEPFRIQALDFGEQPLNANAGWQYGLQDVRGYDSLFSKQYADYMNSITPQTGLPFNRIMPVAWDNVPNVTDPGWDMLNVRYFVTDWIIRAEEDFGQEDLSAQNLEVVYEGRGVRIYENLDALPRAYTVPSLDAVADVVPATITSYENNTVFVDVETDETAWLVLADTYAPGWRAFVRPLGADEDAEEEIDVALAFENFRAVELEPGAWTVRFRYTPQSFQLGAFTSFITGMLIIFLMLVWLWRRFVREDTGNRVIKNSLAPIILNLFNRGIDFAFAFIMLRILGPDDAGIYYYAIVIFGWFDILTNFGLNTLLTREVARDQSRARQFLLNTSALRIGLSGLGLPVLVVFLLLRNAAVSPALDETAIIAIILLYVGLIPNSITTGLAALFYAFEKAEYPAALTTVSTMVKVTLGLGALLLGWGVIGLAGVSIITNVVTLVLMLGLARPLIPSQAAAALSRPMMRGMMGESWPLMLNHLLATIFFKSDVILLEAIRGVAIVGIYSTAYKWLDALNIIPAFFTLALLPMMSRQAQTDKGALKRNYVFGFKSLVMVALPVAVGTTFIAPLLIGLLGGREFLPDGGIALQIMIWSIPLGWINSLTQYVLIALDKQRRITGAFIVAVSFNIITNLIFIPTYGFQAAAVTTIISELVLLVGFAWLLWPELGHINYGRVLWKPLVASAVMLGLTLVIWPFSPLLALSVGSAAYLGMLALLNPLTAEEAQRLVAILPRRLRPATS